MHYTKLNNVLLLRNEMLLRIKILKAILPPEVLKQFRAPKQNVFILLYVWQIYYSDPSPRSLHLPLEYGSRFKLSRPGKASTPSSPQKYRSRLGIL